jgi:hypothetical protein
MKAGDLVRVVKNDMSIVIKNPGLRDDKFYDKQGIILKKINENFRIYFWYLVLFPSGIYEAREDAIEVINESR